VAMIRYLVAERQARRNEAVSGIAEGWGKRQTVAGPYLAIPYERHWTVVKRETVDGKLREIRTERSESQVVRLPAASVEWTVDAEISEKARGIYKARLYGAKLQAQGAFSLPARAGLEDGASRYKWDAPRLVLGISDPLGIRAAPAVSVNGRNYDFAPGPGDSALAGGLLRLPVQPDGRTDLRLPDRTGRPLPATRARLEVWLPLHRPHLRRLSSVRAPAAPGHSSGAIRAGRACAGDVFSPSDRPVGA